jgi:transposase
VPLIAEATLLKFVLRLHLALEGWKRSAIDELLISPAMNVDETSVRVDKKNQ